LYLTASTGYNLSFGKSNFENYTYNKLVGAFYTQNKNLFEYSLGKGMNFNIGVGYTTKRHIGFELEGSYLLGMKTVGISQIYDEYDIFQKEIWGRFYRISPSVHLICPLKELSIKMSVGGLIGFGKMYFNQQTPSFRYDNEFSGGYCLGFKAGIGISYQVIGNLNLFADITLTNAYFSPTNGRVTKFVSGGHDYTDILDTWDREVVYYNSVDEQFSTPDEPAHMLRENFAASSIGLQVGIQWSLWRKKEKEEKTD